MMLAYHLVHDKQYLGTKCAATKIVAKLQNFEQTQRRMDIAPEKLTTFNNNLDLLKKVITGDES